MISQVDETLEHERLGKGKRVQKEKEICHAGEELQTKAIKRRSELSQEEDRTDLVGVKRRLQEYNLEAEMVFVEKGVEAHRMTETSSRPMAEKRFALE